jgi:hypothetical protein
VLGLFDGAGDLMTCFTASLIVPVTLDRFSSRVVGKITEIDNVIITSLPFISLVPHINHNSGLSSFSSPQLDAEGLRV